MAELAKQNKNHLAAKTSAVTSHRNSILDGLALDIDSIDGESMNGTFGQNGSIHIQPDDQQQFMQEQMEKLGITPLLQIAPDTWKNIAHPVIQAFKLIINSQHQQFQRSHDLALQVDQNNRKFQAQFTKLMKEQSKKEDQIDAMFDRLEKNMTLAFNKFRVDCENQIQKSEIRIEDGYHETQRQMEIFKDKLNRVEETETVKSWVQGLMEIKCGEVHLRVDRCQKQFDSEIKTLIQNHLQIPNLVGPNFEHKSLPEFIQSQMKIRETMVGELEIKHNEVKQSIQDLAEHLEHLMGSQVKDKIDQIQEKEHVISENLKSIEKKTLQEQIPSLRKQIEEMIEDVEKQRIDHKVKIELQNNHVKQVQYELDKLNFQLQAAQESMEQKKNEIIMYTQEINRQIKEGMNSLVKTQDNQKTDMHDKVRSLQLLIDKSEKRLVKQQQVLSDKLELITGQSVHLFSEARESLESGYEDRQGLVSGKNINDKSPSEINNNSSKRFFESRRVTPIQSQSLNRKLEDQVIKEEMQIEDQSDGQLDQTLNQQITQKSLEEEDNQVQQQQMQNYTKISSKQVINDLGQETVKDQEQKQSEDLNDQENTKKEQNNQEQSLQEDSFNHTFYQNAAQNNQQAQSKASQLDKLSFFKDENLKQLSQKNLSNKNTEQIESVFGLQVHNNSQDQTSQNQSKTLQNLEKSLSKQSREVIDEKVFQGKAGVQFKPEKTLSTKKDELLKLNMSTSTHSVNKVIGRVDTLETNMQECMRIIAEILVAVKETKLPSLEKLAYLIKNRMDQQSSAQFEGVRGMNGSFSNDNNKVTAKNENGGSSIKLANFKSYFEKMIGGSGTTKNVQNKLSEMTGFENELKNTHQGIMTPQVKTTSFHYHNQLSATQGRPSSKTRKVSDPQKIYQTINSSEMINSPGLNQAQLQNMKSKFVKESPHPKRNKTQAYNENGLSVVFENQGVIQQENTPIDSEKDKMPQNHEKSKSQFGKKRNTQTITAFQVDKKEYSHYLYETMNIDQEPSKQIINDSSIQDLTSRNESQKVSAKKRKSSRGGSSQLAERLDMLLPPLKVEQLDPNKTAQQIYENQQKKVLKLKEMNFRTAQNSPTRTNNIMPQIKSRPRPIAVKYEEMVGVDQMSPPKSARRHMPNQITKNLIF
eukprot:403374561